MGSKLSGYGPERAPLQRCMCCSSISHQTVALSTWQGPCLLCPTSKESPYSCPSYSTDTGPADHRLFPTLEDGMTVSIAFAYKDAKQGHTNLDRGNDDNNDEDGDNNNNIPCL